MSDNIEQLRQEGWGNCANAECGYFYKKSTITHCPACRLHKDALPTYRQPDYESPSLN